MSSNKRNIRDISPPKTPPRNTRRDITTPTSSTPIYNNFPKNNPLGLDITIKIPDGMPVIIPPPPPTPPSSDENNKNGSNSNNKKKQKKGGMESLINSMNNMEFKEDPRYKNPTKSVKKTAIKRKQNAGKSKARKTKRKSYRQKY